jgi:hypothetical protein
MKDMEIITIMLAGNLDVRHELIWSSTDMYLSSMFFISIARVGRKISFNSSEAYSHILEVFSSLHSGVTICKIN